MIALQWKDILVIIIKSIERMKRKFLFCVFLSIILLCIGCCHKKTEDLSCRLWVYSSFSKVYLIRFNGKDSIETKCGSMKFNNYELLSGFAGRKCELDSVYVVKKCKLPDKQADEITSLLKKINSKAVSDTVRKDVRDVWYFALYLPRQTVCYELVKTQDEDLNLLLKKLVNNSPYFVNRVDRNWQGQEHEDYLIKEFGKHKLLLRD